MSAHAHAKKSDGQGISSRVAHRDNAMKHELQAIATILSLVNPAMCATMFLRIEGGRPRRAQMIDAGKAVMIIAVVLFIAAVAGTAILRVFGISLSAFACAGGGVLVWIGAKMLTSNQNDGGEKNEKTSGNASSLAPLILFAASPGTITGVITVAAAHSQLVPAILAIAVTSIVLLAVLMATARLGGGGSQGGLVRQMVTSYMGLIVIAMGVQFALTGFKDFMGTGS